MKVCFSLLSFFQLQLLDLFYADSVSQNKLQRPNSAFKPMNASIPATHISAFDKFNRDLIDHKIPQNASKRL